jgi:hypothetical protein
MAEGFGQYLNIPPRMREIKKRIVKEGSNDPEDLMIIIIDVLKEEALYPEVGKFYTFIYNAKTPNLRYDQHPLIACTSIEPWGFRGINFHWRKYRQYTWNEVAGKLHVVRYEELDEMLSIPYAKFLTK